MPKPTTDSPIKNVAQEREGGDPDGVRAEPLM